MMETEMVDTTTKALPGIVIAAIKVVVAMEAMEIAEVATGKVITPGMAGTAPVMEITAPPVIPGVTASSGAVGPGATTTNEQMDGPIRLPRFRFRNALYNVELRR